MAKKQTDLDLHRAYRTTFAMLMRAHDAMVKARNAELKPVGLSLRQATALYYIVSCGSTATPTEISRRQFRNPNTASEMMSRLEKEGLVERFKDLKQKNRVRFVLTEKGEFAFHSAQLRESTNRVMGMLTAGEHTQLCELLDKLRRAALTELDMDPGQPFPITHREHGIGE